MTNEEFVTKYCEPLIQIEFAKKLYELGLLTVSEYIEKGNECRATIGLPPFDISQWSIDKLLIKGED